MVKQDTQKAKAELLKRMEYYLPALRAAAKLRQSDVAKEINLTRESYNRIESGKRPLTWKNYLALLVFYKKKEQTREMIAQLNLQPKGYTFLQPEEDKNATNIHNAAKL